MFAIFLLSGGFKCLVLILHFAAKKILNRDYVSRAVQMSDCKQQCQLGETTHKPKEFLEFVNKCGWGSDTKIPAYSTIW